jgi:hypothetical protein
MRQTKRRAVRQCAPFRAGRVRSVSTSDLALRPLMSASTSCGHPAHSPSAAECHKPAMSRCSISARKPHVAVGTCVSPHAPRTEPYVRLSRIRLPPRVCDGIAIAGPRMKDGRFREPGIRQLRHPFPRGAILLAAPPQRAPPEVGDVVPKDVQGTTVGRHGVVLK